MNNVVCVDILWYKVRFPHIMSDCLSKLFKNTRCWFYVGHETNQTNVVKPDITVDLHATANFSFSITSDSWLSSLLAPQTAQRSSHSLVSALHWVPSLGVLELCWKVGLNIPPCSPSVSLTPYAVISVRQGNTNITTVTAGESNVQTAGWIEWSILQWSPNLPLSTSEKEKHKLPNLNSVSKLISLTGLSVHGFQMYRIYCVSEVHVVHF